MFKITCLIPVFNEKKFLKRLFKSLGKQKNKNFKIIFCNDSSTDNSLKMLEEFKSKNSNFDIIILNNSSNKGIAYSRNKLINNCATDYFYFIDSDDTIRKKTTKILNKIIEKQDYDLVYLKSHLFFYGIKVFNYILNNGFNVKDKKHHSKKYLEKNTFFIWNKLINKKYYQSLNIKFQKGWIMEDFALTIPLHYFAKKATFSKYRAYNYYRHSNTATAQTKNYKKLKRRIDSYNYNLEYLISYLNSQKNLNKFKNDKIIVESFFRYFIIVFFSAFYKDVICDNIDKMKETMIKFFNLVNLFKPEIGTNRLKNWTYGAHNLYRFSARINYFIVKKNIENLKKQKNEDN